MTPEQLRGVVNTNALSRLVQLNTEYEALVCKGESSIDFSTLQWDDVSNLFMIASEIKPTQTGSPEFPSKLCHFILPGVYPVIDNMKVGLEQLPYYSHQDYRSYWTWSRLFWTDSDQKDLLISCLRKRIEIASPGSPVFADYPWATKITELCWIGHNSKRNRKGGSTIQGSTWQADVQR